MNLRQLRHFVVLVEMGTFASAAQELNLSQPALSRSIRALEEDLGAQLLDRGRGGSMPTEAGKILLQDAKALLRRAQDLRRNQKALGNFELGGVSFGITPLPASLLLAEVLAAVVNDHPRLAVSATVAGAEELGRQLRREAIEFFIAPRSMLTGTEARRIETFMTIPFSLLVRTGHPLIGRPNLTINDLQGFPLAAVNPDFLNSTNLAGGIDASDLEISIRCDDYTVLLDMTANSDAIWLSSNALLAKASGRLEVLPVVLPKYPGASDFVIVSRRDRELTRAARLIIDRAKTF